MLEIKHQLIYFSVFRRNYNFCSYLDFLYSKNYRKRTYLIATSKVKIYCQLHEKTIELLRRGKTFLSVLFLFILSMYVFFLSKNEIFILSLYRNSRFNFSPTEGHFLLNKSGLDHIGTLFSQFRINNSVNSLCFGSIKIVNKI